MLLVLHILLIGFFVGLSIYFAKHKRNSYDDRTIGCGAVGVAVVFLVTVLIGVYAESYDNYVKLREYKDGLVLQHDLKALSAISKTISNDNNLVAETRDGYYEGLINGINGAKYRINKYNQTIISKKLYGSNFFYGLYVIEPDDDMKLIDVSEYDFNIGE